MENRVERIEAAMAAERRPPGEQFVHKDAEAEDVAPLIYFAATGLLRRHVRYGAQRRPRIGVRLEERFTARISAQRSNELR